MAVSNRHECSMAHSKLPVIHPHGICKTRSSPLLRDTAVVSTHSLAGKPDCVARSLIVRSSTASLCTLPDTQCSSWSKPGSRGREHKCKLLGSQKYIMHGDQSLCRVVLHDAWLAGADLAQTNILRQRMDAPAIMCSGAQSAHLVKVVTESCG